MEALGYVGAWDCACCDPQEIDQTVAHRGIHCCELVKGAAGMYMIRFGTNKPSETGGPGRGYCYYSSMATIVACLLPAVHCHTTVRIWRACGMPLGWSMSKECSHATRGQTLILIQIRLSMCSTRAIPRGLSKYRYMFIIDHILLSTYMGNLSSLFNTWSKVTTNSPLKHLKHI